MRVSFILPCICGFFLAATFAQGPNNGAVSGTVTDTSGAAVPAVKVTASSPALQGELTSITTEQGDYRFPTLSIGLYRFRYEAPGFGVVIRDQVNVTLGFAITLDVKLVPASQQQTVTVTGEVPLVDTLNSTVQAGFAKKQLDNGPHSASLWSGVRDASDIGSPNCNS